MSFRRLALAFVFPLSVFLVGHATGCSGDTSTGDASSDAGADGMVGPKGGIRCGGSGSYYHCCTKSPPGNEAAPPTCVDGRAVCPSDQYVDSERCENTTLTYCLDDEDNINKPTCPGQCPPRCEDESWTCEVSCDAGADADDDASTDANAN